jgi:hypothetical protein
LVKSLFPECREETLVDPAGNTSCYFYDVTADVVDKGRGLTGTFHPSGEVSRFVHFPEDLPNGPFHGDFKGCVFLPESGKYRLGFIGTASISLNMGGKRIMPGKEFMAPAGYYGIQISVLAPPGKCSLGIILQTPNGNEMNLDSTQLTTLPLNFGLLATYHSSHAGFYDQEFYIWEQVIDYDNRYAYPFLSQGAAERVEPVHWAGKLMAEKAGWYILRPWTTGKTYLSIDGKKYYFPEKCPGMRIHLSRGFHPFSIDSPDNPNNFNFSWLPPGQTDFSVVPFQAFGTTQLF